MSSLGLEIDNQVSELLTTTLDVLMTDIDNNSPNDVNNVPNESAQLFTVINEESVATNAVSDTSMVEAHSHPVICEISDSSVNTKGNSAERSQHFYKMDSSVINTTKVLSKLEISLSQCLSTKAGKENNVLCSDSHAPFLSDPQKLEHISSGKTETFEQINKAVASELALLAKDEKVFKEMPMEREKLPNDWQDKSQERITDHFFQKQELSHYMKELHHLCTCDNISSEMLTSSLSGEKKLLEMDKLCDDMLDNMESLKHHMYESCNKEEKLSEDVLDVVKDLKENIILCHQYDHQCIHKKYPEDHNSKVSNKQVLEIIRNVLFFGCDQSMTEFANNREFQLKDISDEVFCHVREMINNFDNSSYNPEEPKFPYMFENNLSISNKQQREILDVLEQDKIRLIKSQVQNEKAILARNDEVLNKKAKLDNIELMVGDQTVDSSKNVSSGLPMEKCNSAKVYTVVHVESHTSYVAFPKSSSAKRRSSKPPKPLATIAMRKRPAIDPLEEDLSAYTDFDLHLDMLLPPREW